MGIMRVVAVVAFVMLFLIGGVMHPEGARAEDSERLTSSFMAENPCTAVGAYGFSATFVDPYWLRGKSPQQVDSLLYAQKEVGIATVILQWTAFRSKSGSVGTTFPADPALKFKVFDSSASVFLGAARAAGMKIWVGLLVAPNVFDNGASPVLLDSLRADTLAVATELQSKYSAQIDGWYLPIEPGALEISTPESSALMGSWIGSISDFLHEHTGKPVMVSPAVPTMGIHPHDFAAAYETIMSLAHVDVWNVQDGYGWTSWTASQNATLITRAQLMAAKYGAEVWATLYLPYGNDGLPTINPVNLQRDLRAVGAVGVPLTAYVFSRAFNPDAQLLGAESRAAQLTAYKNYCFAP